MKLELRQCNAMGGEQVDVLVATKDIYPGETVDASNAEVKTWLSDLFA